ncbi:acetolactate synthase-1/2/3 large subunit [Novosphingobium kunmingense]|uniref:Acetolactate synthase-1/2/3 large subunit n=2 Tax=Novosphingobium kunmingense TaxID=1211806 RepID=A0A2N0H6N7_9SPHN|nr:acetolactate synthase-1/2/3 large subunit [Novosphingobium kunmingense]
MSDQPSCAEYLADVIVDTGCGTVFALAGATHAPLLFALEDRGVAIVGGRHESGTVGAADGYARRTGRTGFALIVAEQGLSNALTALLTAAQAETPLVVIATRFPDSWVEPAIQFDVDRHDLTAPFLKFSRTVPSPNRLGDYVHAAIKAANEGVPGPALLVLPLDYLAKPCTASKRAPNQAARLPSADPTELTEAVDLIEAAQRPIIVTDGRAAQFDCAKELTDFAAMGVPVLGNGLGRGLAPEVSPTGYPWPFAQFAASQADLVIVVGARMNMWFGYGLAPRFAHDARFLHIDTCAEAIGRNRSVDLALVADPAKTLGALVTALSAISFGRDPSWLALALEPRVKRVDELIESYGDRLHAVSIGAALDAALPEDRVLVCDGADSMNFTFARMRVHRSRSYSDLLPFGAMGAGFPIAIGMAAAEAEAALREGRRVKPITFVTGDGSLGFFIAELATLARSALPLTVLVSNDGRWGTEFHGQTIAYGRTSNTDLGAIDYAAVARGFGCPAQAVTTRNALDAAIREAQSSGGPVVIDVHVDPDGGRIRKLDPLLGMILFEDIAPH